MLSSVVILFSSSLNCSICELNIDEKYLIDAWGNVFHDYHKDDGFFCHSCSRIISQKITNGGYIYSDGRKMCSLCKATAINDKSHIHSSYKSVIKKLSYIGINNLDNKIPIELVDLNKLNNNAKIHAHQNLKGITKIIKTDNNKNEYYISILYGLPKIEFEAVLAHELLHVWIKENKIKLPKNKEEGFCNLGSLEIYNSYNNQFSKIHTKSMYKNLDEAYGQEYRKFIKILEKEGWEKLIYLIKN